jgi:dynein heavy chain
MDAVLDNISIALYNGTLPEEWAKLAPDTRKNLAGWMEHFQKRINQYDNWVRPSETSKYRNMLLRLNSMLFTLQLIQS